MCGCEYVSEKLQKFFKCQNGDEICCLQTVSDFPRPFLKLSSCKKTIIAFNQISKNLKGVKSKT